MTRCETSRQAPRISAQPSPLVRWTITIGDTTQHQSHAPSASPCVLPKLRTETGHGDCAIVHHRTTLTPPTRRHRAEIPTSVEEASFPRGEYQRLVSESVERGYNGSSLRVIDVFKKRSVLQTSHGYSFCMKGFLYSHCLFSVIVFLLRLRCISQQISLLYFFPT